VLLATALIALASLALVGVQYHALRLGRQSRQRFAANQLARDQIARLQDMAPDLYPATTMTFSGEAGDARTASGFPPVPYPKVERDGVTYVINVTHRLSGFDGHAFTVQVGWGGGMMQMTTLVGP
jgi:hypothetical protein